MSGTWRGVDRAELGLGVGGMWHRGERLCHLSFVLWVMERS